MINITIPVLNEERCLDNNIRKLVSFLDHGTTDTHEVVIVDNGSTDATLRIARDLEEEFKVIRVHHIDQRGRGRALRTSWTESTADVLSYMDVDLSGDLSFYPRLLEPISMGAADLSIGSRLRAESATQRGFRREVISRSYNWLVRTLFESKLTDAQCGFKALSKRAAEFLLPLIKDQHWFFDTEMLLLAERLQLRIFELPIRWTDDPDTRVHLLSTAIGDVKGLMRLRRDFKRANRVGYSN